MTKRILINGLGRSGTSWVQKVFDHHPDVLAVHEPDLVYRFEHPITDARVAEMAERYFCKRPLRAMRKRPILAKPYRGAVRHYMRVLYMYGASVFGLILPASRRPFIQVPDFLGPKKPSNVVVKTVTQQNLAPDFAKSNPDMKVVYVLRHPCGYVASQRAGMDAGKMTGVFLPDRAQLAEMFSFDGRSPDDLVEGDFSELEIMAYRWAVLNEAVLRHAGECPNMKIVIYEELCARPREAFKELLEWCGLDWDDNCDDFIAKSLNQSGDADGYHDLVRNPLAAANRWSKTLDPSDQHKVVSIAKKSMAFSVFDNIDTPDLSEL